MVLALFTALATAFSVNTPLGEAPDEPAHFSYAQFIAKNGRLPATLDERRKAGYRAVWPPLYHLLAAAPIAAIGDAPPARLKAVGDSPRRLIPTNGQTIAAFVHTADEAWPWQGIVLAWHLARLVSVLLSAVAVAVTYCIAWKLTHRRGIAIAAAAIHAFLPQFLFTGSVVTDDTLLILLSGLVLLTIVNISQLETAPGWRRWLLLGTLLGLATITKYNALPLWGVTLLWLVWQGRKGAKAQGRKDTEPQTRRDAPATRHSPFAHSPFTHSLLFILLGATLTAGWWFIFIWHNFNQVDALGPVAGSLAALTAGTADASLRSLSSGDGLNLPPPAAWLTWAGQMFRSFWGLFGGGATIAYPGWIYGLLAMLIALAVAGLVTHQSQFRIRSPRNAIRNSQFAIHHWQLILVFLLFLPLPLLRFALSGSLVETAQGRHLFPALPAIALVLALGFNQIITHYASRFTHHALRFTPAIILFTLALFGLPLIHTAYPPPIPLTTTFSTEAALSSFRAPLAPGIELVHIQPGPAANGALPLTLLWQAGDTPSQDYLIDISLRDAAGNQLGAWRGQPVGGRYPTRAWDPGDTLRDAIPLPLSPGPAVDATLYISLLDADNQPVAPAAQWPVSLPTRPSIADGPNALRADGLSAADPFGYRSTLSFLLPGQTEPPTLTAPDGTSISPDLFLPGSIAHFIVGPDWPSGEYTVHTKNSPFTIYHLPFTIRNRPRQFTPPPMQQRLDANFAGQLTLLGYDLPQRRVQPGQSFPITLYLQANRTMGENLAIFNHLLDAQAVQRGGADRIPQQYYTTLLWVPGEIVSDSYAVPVDADAPPGIYWLDVGLYPTRRPEFSLPLVVDGRPIERNSVSIGPLKVGGPPPGVVVQNPQPQHIVNQFFGNQITLLGYDLANEQVDKSVNNSPHSPNSTNSTNSMNSINLNLYWQAEKQPTADYTVFVHFS
jgi:hypothetical protein